MAPDQRRDTRPDDEAGIHAFECGLDDEVRAMERESELVAKDIEETRKDWEAKRADRGVPGARPREDSPPQATGADEGAGDWSGTAEAASDAGQ